MSLWRRLPFTLMALFALCALTLPSLVWACPMSGRISAGDATQICRAATQTMAAQTTASMPCCAPTHVAPNGAMQMPSCLAKCCKPIAQLPSQDSNKNSALHQVNADFSGLLDQLSQAAFSVILPASSVAPLVIEPPTRAIWDDPIVPLSPAQFAPGSLLGRAPPRQF